MRPLPPGPLMLLLIVSSIASLTSGCSRRSVHEVRVLGVRTNALTGRTEQRLVNEEEYVVVTEYLTPDGTHKRRDYTCDKYFVVTGVKTQELESLRSTKVNPRTSWFCFYPIDLKTSWVGLSYRGDDTNRYVHIGLIGIDRLVHERVLAFPSGNKAMLELDKSLTEDVLNDLDTGQRADLHLYEGNSILLYRTCLARIEYHRYHVLEDRIEDIGLEEAERIKKTASDIHPVENLIYLYRDLK